MTNISTEQSEPEEKAIEILDLDLKSLQPKGHPWKKSRELEDQKIAEFITMEDIYEKVNSFTNPRDKALFVILYLCAARIEEIVRYNGIKWGKKEVRIIKMGKSPKKGMVQDYKSKKIVSTKHSMIRTDITLEETNGRKTMVFRIRNLKNKQRGRATKLVPLPLDNELNLKFKKIIDNYVAMIPPEQEMFPIGIRRAEHIILKAIGFNCHFLRKVRLTHLVRYYNFTDQKLQAFAGWTDSRPAKHYIRTTWEDLVKSM